MNKSPLFPLLTLYTFVVQNIACTFNTLDYVNGYFIGLRLSMFEVLFRELPRRREDREKPQFNL